MKIDTPSTRAIQDREARNQEPMPGSPSAAAQAALGAASRVLILRLRSLGDCVLSTPAIQLLRKWRPKLKIGVVVEPAWMPVFEGNPDISAILPPTMSAVWDFDPDFCLDLHGGSRAARLTFFSGAKSRAGFAHGRMRAAYNICIPTAQAILGVNRTVHTAEHLASAMFYLGIPKQEVPRARLFADSEATPPQPQPYAVIHPVAATPEKTWSARRFLRLAEHLRDAHGLDVVFVAAEDQDLSEFQGWKILAGAPLAQLKTLLSGAEFFAGNDSGPAHMAAAFGVPSVVLFGPSDPAIWGPWRTRGEALHSRNIADIEVGQVTAVIDRLRLDR